MIGSVLFICWRLLELVTLIPIMGMLVSLRAKNVILAINC